MIDGKLAATSELISSRQSRYPDAVGSKGDSAGIRPGVLTPCQPRGSRPSADAATSSAAASSRRIHPPGDASLNAHDSADSCSTDSWPAGGGRSRGGGGGSSGAGST
eukprot:146149-Chlamydomonas_euryale.AAC.1